VNEEIRALIRTGYARRIKRDMVLQFLPEEELLVTLGVVIEGAEHLVAALLIERPRLEGMGVELDCMEPRSRA
jgi:hypothetical protein